MNDIHIHIQGDDFNYEDDITLEMAGQIIQHIGARKPKPSPRSGIPNQQPPKAMKEAYEKEFAAIIETAILDAEIVRVSFREFVEGLEIMEGALRARLNLAREQEKRQPPL